MPQFCYIKVGYKGNTLNRNVILMENQIVLPVLSNESNIYHNIDTAVKIFCGRVFEFEPVPEKINNLGSDQVRHKPGCSIKEDGQRLEILCLSRRGIVLSV